MLVAQLKASSRCSAQHSRLPAALGHLQHAMPAREIQPVSVRNHVAPHVRPRDQALCLSSLLGHPEQPAPRPPPPPHPCPTNTPSQRPHPRCPTRPPSGPSSVSLLPAGTHGAARPPQ